MFFFLCLFHEQMNSHTKKISFFSQLSLFFFLCHFVLSGPFFPCLSSIRLLHLFATVPILWGHHFSCVYFSFSPFSFVKVHCEWLLPCVYLCSIPPPLSLHLSSVITALDSSSDGKCFSIPLSPSLPLNLHLSLFLTKQITSWLL